MTPAIAQQLIARRRRTHRHTIEQRTTPIAALAHRMGDHAAHCDDLGGYPIEEEEPILQTLRQEGSEACLRCFSRTEPMDARFKAEWAKDGSARAA